ncbi:TetR/AcrR family transcriptional regulator [Geodermatophilus chilensis]|uniref:TetR/AcrR family transcriptional regulator n=1 Tax=Geodermatophilus chilensis TaxID=2035835 RepID=UPI000C25D8EE|nr:TetR/AcrR family transcriptional regulator [Geodermatophilus chilensis]
MPRLWTETIADHRHAVRDAVLDATAALVAERGLAGIAMSQLAERAGIGRATLYKYFPDLDAVLRAWHQRQVGRHLEQVVTAADGAGGGAWARLEAVLRAYASSIGQHDGSLMAVSLHGGEHVGRAHAQLGEFLAGLLAAGVRAGCVRADVPVGELAGYALAALSAAAGQRDAPARERLVGVTLAGLRPPG